MTGSVLSVVALVVGGWLVWVFNRLVGLRNRSLAAWADIDVQLRRRHDLVGNLVEAVKGYASHERSTFEEVARARTRAETAAADAAPGPAARAESALTAGMKTLFALAEDYPELKASARFLDLQRELVAIEDDLQNARRYYNAVVRDLNTRIESMPDLIVARLLRFRQHDFFELDHARQALAPVIDMQGAS